MQRPSAHPETYLSVDRKAELFAFLVENIENWKSMQFATLTFERTMGLTNQVFIVSASHANPATDVHRIILRLFGEKSERCSESSSWSSVFFSRPDEERHLQIVQECVKGAEILAFFGNGRIERFLDGDQLNPRTIRSNQVLCCIAKVMFKAHCSIWRPIEIEYPLEMIERGRNYVIEKMELWLDLGCQLMNQKIESKLREFRYDWKPWLYSALENMKSLVSRTKSPIILAHNDAHYGNFIHHANDTVTLIDWEYSFPNYRAFDLANFLVEMMSDYSKRPNQHVKNLPTREMVIHFLECYKAASDKYECKENMVESVEVLLEEVETFAPVSLMFWAYWQVLMAAKEEQENHKMTEDSFDYLDGALCRFKIYSALQHNKWFK